MDRWCEMGILALVLTILVLGPLAMGAVRPQEFLVIQGLTIGVMLLWGARLWLNPHPQLLWPPICWAVAAFTFYAVARYLTADIEYVARQELVHILVYAFLFLAILNNLYRRETIKLVVCALVFLAMAVSLYAGYQFLTRSHQVWNFSVHSDFGASGTYISRNHLAGFLEMLLPLGLAYTLTSRLKPGARVFLGYASLVMLGGIAATVSRGAYAATALAMLLFFGLLFLHRNHRLPSYVLLWCLLFAGAYSLPQSFPVLRRLKPLLTGEGVRGFETDTRYYLWRAAVQIWQENVWWGAGPGHYDYRFRQFRPVQVQLRPGWVHNDYLNTLAEWGTMGAVLVASALVLLGWGVKRTWPAVRGAPKDLGAERGSNRFAFVLGASVGLVAMLVHSAVDFNMHIPANAILVVALMALLSGFLRFATNRYWVSIRGAGRVAVSAVLLTSGLYLGYEGRRHATEYAWLQRAARAPNFSTAQAECLQNAFAADPMNADTACAIGEAFRMQSSGGDNSYPQLAEKAMEWFSRSIKLNPWGGYSHLSPWAGYGWCLDWLGRFDQAERYFQRADELNPNNYFITVHVGLHYLQLGNSAAANPWFERSLRLNLKDKELARNYLEIVTRRMLEAATNELRGEVKASLR